MFPATDGRDAFLTLQSERGASLAAMPLKPIRILLCWNRSMPMMIKYSWLEFPPTPRFSPHTSALSEYLQNCSKFFCYTRQYFKSSRYSNKIRRATDRHTFKFTGRPTCAVVRTQWQTKHGTNSSGNRETWGSSGLQVSHKYWPTCR